MSAVISIHLDSPGEPLSFSCKQSERPLSKKVQELVQKALPQGCAVTSLRKTTKAWEWTFSDKTTTQPLESSDLAKSLDLEILPFEKQKELVIDFYAKCKKIRDKLLKGKELNEEELQFKEHFSQEKAFDLLSASSQEFLKEFFELSTTYEERCKDAPHEGSLRSLEKLLIEKWSDKNLISNLHLEDSDPSRQARVQLETKRRFADDSLNPFFQVTEGKSLGGLIAASDLFAIGRNGLNGVSDGVSALQNGLKIASLSRVSPLLAPIQLFIGGARFLQGIFYIFQGISWILRGKAKTEESWQAKEGKIKLFLGLSAVIGGILSIVEASVWLALGTLMISAFLGIFAIGITLFPLFAVIGVEATIGILTFLLFNGIFVLSYMNMMAGATPAIAEQMKFRKSLSQEMKKSPKEAFDGLKDRLTKVSESASTKIKKAIETELSSESISPEKIKEEMERRIREEEVKELTRERLHLERVMGKEFVEKLLREEDLSSVEKKEFLEGCLAANKKKILEQLAFFGIALSGLFGSLISNFIPALDVPVWIVLNAFFLVFDSPILYEGLFGYSPERYREDQKRIQMEKEELIASKGRPLEYPRFSHL